MKLNFNNFILVLFTLSLNAQVIDFTGFEAFSDEQQFIQSSWTSEGFTVPWVNGFNQSRAYVDDAYAHSGTKSLRVEFPINQYGPSNSGAQAPLRVTGQDQLYISYWLRFSDNFSWGNTSEGGKLPGLAGGSNCSGCATCVGTNGFSARLMWRTGGTAVLYLYHMDKAGSCGDNLNLQVVTGVNFAFQKGQWYNIIERVKINSGNNFDGEVELWVNEQPALLVTGIRFVNNGDKVDNLYFSTFHGGSTSGWAPTTTCHIWFDDVKIGTTATDVFTTLDLMDAESFEQLHMNGLLEKGGNIGFPETFQGSIEWYSLIGQKMAEQQYKDSQTVPSLLPGAYVAVVRDQERLKSFVVRVE